jgi:hypothetical protein
MWRDDLNAHSLQLKFPKFKPRESHSKVCVLPMALSPKAVLSISCISNAVFPILKQELMQMLCSFKSVVRKSQIALNTHNYKHHVRFQVLMAASYLFMQGSLIALMMEEVRTSEMSSTSI